MSRALPTRPEGFDQVLEAVPDGIVVTGPDGRIVFANENMAALAGWPRAELVGMAVEELVPAGIRGRHGRHRTAYQREPGVRPMGSHLDIRLRRRDGGEIPVDIALSPLTTPDGLLFVASVRDVTERRLAEAELQRAQERFRLVLEGVQDYAIFMLDADGRVSTWNPGAERIKGYAADEILGRDFAVFYRPEDVEAGKPARLLAEAAVRGRAEDEGWRVRKDGSRFWASVFVSALHDRDGRLQGFAKVTRDGTGRKRQDDQLRALLEVAQAILEGREQEGLLRLITARARRLVEADLALLTILDPVDGSFVVRMADGRRAAKVQGMRVPPEGTILKRIIDTGQPAVVDGSRGPGTPATPVLDAANAGPALVVPLASGERRFGTLGLANARGGRRFGEQELQLLQLFATQAAMAIDYTRAREELRRLAVLDDRERIGRELHDGAIQALFSVGMGLQGLAMLTPDAGIRERLEDAVGQIDDVIRDLRNYIFGLRPGLAADRHLDQALRDLAQRFGEQHDVACAVDIDHTVASRLTGRAADILQFTREALANVGRHAAAATCRVSLRQDADGAVLEVEDDGRGFVLADDRGQGWGLRNLEERAAAVGGELQIESVPGEGTAVRLTVPL